MTSNVSRIMFNVNFLRNVSSRCMSTRQYLSVETDIKTGLSTVIINRPPVNSMNLELLTELKETFLELEKSKCRGMLITSALPTVFSSGLDLMEMYKPNPKRLKVWWTTVQDMWLALYGSSYPSVAIINGHSPAGGYLISSCCEYRVMVQGKYSIGFNEAKVSISPPMWLIKSFQDIVSTRKAEVDLTTGKLFSVDEALKEGLIDEVASDKDEAITKGKKFLSTFENISPMARYATKALLRHEVINWLKENKEKDLDFYVKLFSMPEMQINLEKYLVALKQKKR